MFAATAAGAALVGARLSRRRVLVVRRLHLVRRRPRRAVAPPVEPRRVDRRGVAAAERQRRLGARAAPRRRAAARRTARRQRPPRSARSGRAVDLAAERASPWTHLREGLLLAEVETPAAVYATGVARSVRRAPAPHTAASVVASTSSRGARGRRAETSASPALAGAAAPPRPTSLRRTLRPTRSRASHRFRCRRNGLVAEGFVAVVAGSGAARRPRRRQPRDKCARKHDDLKRTSAALSLTYFLSRGGHQARAPASAKAARLQWRRRRRCARLHVPPRQRRRGRTFLEPELSASSRRRSVRGRGMPRR